ncbi:hypothetical protein BELL_0075g00160 [Botrytis elliptica]|uniref:Uncharacterized protein n=1 Tax=Botrytis elliptica TaxID=278938 RepID=A0A4Z1JWB0_9HELO|nr:hypothetical protein BELL_0075g00160 [Botrytis elliptica]
MVQGALKSTKSALAGGNRSNGAGKKAALGPKKGQRVIKAKKDGLRRSEVLRKVSCLLFWCLLFFGCVGKRRGEGIDKEGKRRNMMTHLHMHGFPSGLLERVETSLTSLSLTAMTEKTLGAKAGHLELLGVGKKSKGKDGKNAGEIKGKGNAGTTIHGGEKGGTRKFG